MKVKVTKKHIKKGKRGQPTGCPIALALKEQYGLKRPRVHGDQVHFPGKSCDLPDKASFFIQQFDSGEKVVPFEFSIRKNK